MTLTQTFTLNHSISRSTLVTSLTLAAAMSAYVAGPSLKPAGLRCESLNNLWAQSFSDASWSRAAIYKPATDSFGASDIGTPWPTGPVAALRRSFRQDREVVSARLYATALGAYKFHLNGSPVGDQILAPGWMDFRGAHPLPGLRRDQAGQARQQRNRGVPCSRLVLEETVRTAEEKPIKRLSDLELE